MDVTNKKRVIESLELNEADLALVSILPKDLSVNKMDLLKNRLYLVGSRSMKLKKGNKLQEIFNQAPIIFREQGSGTRQVMEKFLEKNGITVSKKIELTSNEAVKQAILAGLGFSIMPIIGLKNELLNKEIQIIPIKGLPVSTTWSLIWLKEKRLSPVVNNFLAHLEKNKQEIIQHNFDWQE